MKAEHYMFIESLMKCIIEWVEWIDNFRKIKNTFSSPSFTPNSEGIERYRFHMSTTSKSSPIQLTGKNKLSIIR